MGKAIGLGYPFDVTWVDDIYSLKKLYVEAGLEVEKSWRTRSYLPERSYEADEADKVFEENIHRDPSLAGKKAAGIRKTKSGPRYGKERCERTVGFGTIIHYMFLLDARESPSHQVGHH